MTFMVCVEIRTCRRAVRDSVPGADEVDSISPGESQVPQIKTIAGKVFAGLCNRISKRHDVRRRSRSASPMRIIGFRAAGSAPYGTQGADHKNADEPPGLWHSVTHERRRMKWQEASRQHGFTIEALVGGRY